MFEINHVWHGIDLIVVFQALVLLSVATGGAAAWQFASRRRRAWVTFTFAAMFATAAYAANTKLSSLSAASAITDTDLFYDVQSSGSGGVKATALQIKTYIGSGTGSVTSVSGGCGAVAAPNPIIATGAITAKELVNAQTLTSYTIGNADCGQLTTFNNSSATAVTLPQAGTGGNFLTGWFADYHVIGAGTVVITPTTSTINGASTFTLTTGQGTRIVSDGTNYQVTQVPSSGGGGAVDVQTFCPSGCTSTVAGGGTATWSRPGSGSEVIVVACGGGGGGGGGAQQVSGSTATGGGGGGASDCHQKVFTFANAGSTQTVTVGAGGTVGAGATTTTTAGGNGGIGGTTSFGSLESFFGGGGGGGGVLAGSSIGGGGGGPWAAGFVGTTTVITGCLGNGGASGGNGFNINGICGPGGGGAVVAGGRSGAYAGLTAGSGGSGGALTAVPAGTTGGNGGGGVGCKTPPTGGAIGTTPTSTNPDFPYHPGCGGAGGGGQLGQTGVPGNGSAGTAGGGGGGGGPVCSSGGACTAQNGGAGGIGGDGWMMVVTQ